MSYTYIDERVHMYVFVCLHVALIDVGSLLYGAGRLYHFLKS